MSKAESVISSRRKLKDVVVLNKKQIVKYTHR